MVYNGERTVCSWDQFGYIMYPKQKKEQRGNVVERKGMLYFVKYSKGTVKAIG